MMLPDMNIETSIVLNFCSMASPGTQITWNFNGILGGMANNFSVCGV